MSVSSAATITDLPDRGTAGDVVEVNCYSIVGDGGGGTFYCEATPDSAKIETATASIYAITNATNAKPIVITTSIAHGFTTGQSVLIQGVLGNTAANGSWQVVVQSATPFEFALLNSAGNGTYIAPTPPAVNTVSTVTLTSAAAHGLETGAKIIIAGATGMTEINGTWTLVYVISPSSFSIPCSVTDTTHNYDEGTASVGDGRMSFPAKGGVRWVRHADASVYNVRWFGAKGDGVADDLPAFQAALDVIANDTRRPMQNRGGIIHVPAGKYCLNGNLVIQDTVILQGVAADNFQAHSASELRFTAGYGIVVMNQRGTTGHRGDATKIRDLTIYGNKLSVPTYQYDYEYKVGDLVTLPHDPRFVYECVAVPEKVGVPVEEWVGKSSARPANAWVGNHRYESKDRVTPTECNGHTYICTQPGTSAKDEPKSWISDPNDKPKAWRWEPKDTVTDGGVEWTREDDPPLPDKQWQPNHPYLEGSRIYASTAIGYSYTCSVGGPSAAEQTTFGAPTVIESSGVKWTRDPGYLLQFFGTRPMRYGVSATDSSVYWTALHTYRHDDVIRAPGITSYLFLNITGTAATSGGSEPSWKTKLGETTIDGGITWQAIDPSGPLIQDNTVTWAVRCHAGIMADCIIYVDSVSLQNFTGAGVHMRGAAEHPPSSISFWWLENVSIMGCNGGIYVHGGEAQGGYASGCTVYGSNTLLNEKDYGIWDDGFGGSAWVGCRVEWVGGTPFRATQPAGASVFVGCYDESYAKPRITSGVVIGSQLAHQGRADLFTADSTAKVISQSGHFGLMATDWKATDRPIYTYLGGSAGIFQNAILGVQPTKKAEDAPSGKGEDAPSGIVWTKDWTSCPDGWYVWSYNPDAHYPWAAFACSGQSAVPFRKDLINGGNPARFWLPGGEFYIGSFSTGPRCFRAYIAPPTNGTWVVGDLVFNTDPSSNGVFAWQCTAKGEPGTWTPIYVEPVKTVAGTPSDANFYSTPSDGTLALDTTNDFLYVRTGGAWKHVASNLPAAMTLKDASAPMGASGPSAIYSASGQLRAKDSNNTALFCGYVAQALTNDFTTTNNTATSTNLTFAVGASDVWFVEVMGCISSGDVNGIKVAFSAPMGATVVGDAFGHNTSTTNYIDNQLTSTSLSPTFVNLADNPQLFIASAMIKMDGTHSGSITFQAAPVTAGQTCTIKAGACMRATRVDAV